MFLYLFWAEGSLSWGFARNAGWGDVAVGTTAPLVAAMLATRHRLTRPVLWAWCVLGILDLIVAPVSARLYGPGALGDFPLSVIPLFLGPPLGILLHLAVLRADHLQARARPRA